MMSVNLFPHMKTSNCQLHISKHLNFTAILCEIYESFNVSPSWNFSS